MTYKKKFFQGMNYRDVQRANSKNRTQLDRKDKVWLKENFYKNIGWNNVINLYQKIEDFLLKSSLAELTLEELFLEADRIGNKYLTIQEIQHFHQNLSREVNEISEEIDKQFPDTEVEFIDFSKNPSKRYWNQAN
ncbi:MAG: hypothetical protein RMY28_005295 [Nostoc sp. ChiSLP01]|nr:hypothetical protein [Nostoc sp. CmiSLP01]MDZ8284999.1 hypothetical protein [Nostoc sp. ChiSLP01]